MDVQWENLHAFPHVMSNGKQKDQYNEKTLISSKNQKFKFKLISNYKKHSKF
jgi:hypothetical protein